MTATDSSPTDTVTPELVVLLDEGGRAVGTADKAGVHHAATPLHLAFSCYLFDDAGNVLVTQRALHKRTFPGVWTNSCCGHPAPGEPLEDAVRRRVEQELGTTVTELRLVLPRFRYRAEQDGTVENEMCPVFVARVPGTAPGTISADPDEVGEARWEPWAPFRAAVLDGSRQVSVWCREQVDQLPADPVSAAAADVRDLPPAARLTADAP
ncbi:isopentenyl-diphosphate delta-isomerase [Nocardioides luteus]|uniref:Isopentenyl-diphosphate Delta-isomerase n=1 Tax=Nocardioides luteus TaxID=1844 RepID=A0ABQ5SSV8_9ACTN|nr:isopentenyl-diphosphate Delta-isomerase [Nocardioides luteus]MDR7311376.1 isopentenyl-diphosphate delta-isomerase [Nocardioides luteus]GGR65484.1 isopentenyl-diphosphate Delta-isomerase [Nocardioides luteus]GLJ66881.1 isopentenyl-diphosphate Delta-isomerase [Nocardioides luteus]